MAAIVGSRVLKGSPFSKDLIFSVDVSFNDGATELGRRTFEFALNCKGDLGEADRRLVAIELAKKITAERVGLQECRRASRFLADITKQIEGLL